MYLYEPLLVGILATMGVGLWEGVVPYFPCEISKTATGRWSGWILFGTAATFWFLCSQGRTQPPIDAGIGYGALGFALLSLFGTRNWWSMHMVGVFVMLYGAGHTAWYAQGEKGAAMRADFLRGALVYALRILCCGLAVLHWEMQQPVSAHTYRIFLLSPARALEWFQAFRAGHRGGGFTYTLTLNAYRAGGVLQWVALYYMTRPWHAVRLAAGRGA